MDHRPIGYPGAAAALPNTDLDLQPKQKGIIQVILIGLLANTWIETTSRFAAELGYHVPW